LGIGGGERNSGLTAVRHREAGGLFGWTAAPGMAKIE
jgi:hypothetical protein